MYGLIQGNQTLSLEVKKYIVKFQFAANLKIVFTSIWICRICIFPGLRSEHFFLNPGFFFFVENIYCCFRNTARLVWKMVEDGCRLHQSSGVYIINSECCLSTDRIPNGPGADSEIRPGVCELFRKFGTKSVYINNYY